MTFNRKHGTATAQNIADRKILSALYLYDLYLSKKHDK
ncbi:hypothetical protein GJA_1070 [Janthinobacterium agaricidamnosum NBRC 102515 = DSM 9628]|uniref:Uncharacterized protein n=1 Tax=Janthinobacterium agaricidamnosum NBRC 102515 = DSM 9628 TaxID=1349767 RepID=W0V268_9BURK|nr:hypothetical protein GJA_1070 [Janthinobacterium agaricidamnosum NBRC 102515 = DSM 9628]